jgi:hypothetical protein
MTAAEGAGASFLARGFLGFFASVAATVDVVSTVTLVNGHIEDEFTVSVAVF